MSVANDLGLNDDTEDVDNNDDDVIYDEDDKNERQ